jgi:hypothetical protein
MTGYRSTDPFGSAGHLTKRKVMYAKANGALLTGAWRGAMEN